MQTFYILEDGSVKRIRVPESDVRNGRWNGYIAARTMDELAKQINEKNEQETRPRFELTVITRKNVTDEAHARELVERAGFEIQRASADGMKRLAYEIQGEDYAHYWYFEGEARNVVQISQVLEQDDEVLCYLLVKVM